MMAKNQVVRLLMIAALVASGCAGPPADATADDEATRIRGPEAPAGQVYVEGEYEFGATSSRVLAQGPYEMLPPVLTYIVSDADGVDIEIGYWLPDVPEGTTVPVIVHASPYHRPAGSVVSRTGTKLFLTENYVSHGYAVAAVAVRGTGGSGGCMTVGGVDERADLSQAVTWLATQKWSNGNVGMTGLSYDGTTPWEVAATGNPHLKTIVPVSGVTDFYGLMFKNGSAEVRGPILTFLYYEYGWNFVTVAGGGSDIERTPDKRVEGALCPAAWEGLAWSGYSAGEGGRDPNGFWDERNLVPLITQNYRGSILLVHGLQDWNVDPVMAEPLVDDLNKTGVPVHQILGQWGHTHPDRKGPGEESFGSLHRMDYAEKLLAWFDYYLKDETAVELGPAVTVQDQTLRWRTEQNWPPRDAQWKTFHLAEGSLLSAEPGGPPGSVTLVVNPVGDNPAQEYLRQTPGFSADFYTTPMTDTVNIAGLPRVHVTVTPQGPTGHLAAWLYDVSPSGAAERIGWATLNLRYYNADEQAQTLVPGQSVVARIQLQPMDARIEQGHRLMLRLWEYSSDDHLGLPLVKDRHTVAPASPVEVNFGGSTLSTVEVPFVARPPDVYFRPPTPPGFQYPFEGVP